MGFVAWLCTEASGESVALQARDDAEFGDAGGGGETALDGEDSETVNTTSGTGLPWDDDAARDYKYEELLGAGLTVAAALWLCYHLFVVTCREHQRQQQQ